MRALTGIKPTAAPHVGNYLGMIEPALRLQATHDAYYFIADYHALTTLHDAARMRAHTREVAATWLALGLDPARTTLFVQHYPIDTSPDWWDDYGASGTTVAQKQNRLLELMSRFDHTVLLTGHNHSAGHSTFSYGGRVLDQYVAPYFGGDNGVDTSRGGGFIALLVSPTRGILEVKTIPGGI